ncbi:MAG: Fe-S-containing hydro-lyase [Lachnospiraceae bacterium]|nr:Fe-S-containing hydro-lyase [Lachnospiraceae bacterium]
MEYYLTTPLTKEKLADLKAGDYVYISGTIYSARDAAHKRMHEALADGKGLPIDITDVTIYYMGPTPSRDSRPLGSAGPTTSSRMDKYTPELFDLGLSAVIGKGRRADAITQSIVKNHCVYFAAVGGAGALLSQCITGTETVAYDDLGTEAIRKLTVENFPAIVIIDSEGSNLYEDVYAKIPEDLR